MDRSNAFEGGGDGREARRAKGSVSEGSESRLAFHVEPTVPDGAKKPSRRLFIKLSWTAAALSYAAPKVAHAQGGAQLSPVPVSLPFLREFAVSGLEGSLEDPAAGYAFSLAGMLDIDEAGEATVTDLSMQGDVVSGEGVGPISIEQRGMAVGAYAGTRLDVRIPVVYSDQEFDRFGTLLRMQGTLTAVEGNVGLSVMPDPDLSISVKGFIPPEP